MNPPLFAFQRATSSPSFSDSSTSNGTPLSGATGPAENPRKSAIFEIALTNGWLRAVECGGQRDLAARSAPSRKALSFAQTTSLATIS